MKKTILFTGLYLLLFSYISFSQEKISFNGKTYVNKSGKWFDNFGHELNSEIFTVKFKNSDKNLYSSKYGKIIRSNSLGYVDLELPKGKSLFNFLNQLKLDANIETIDINTYGSYELNANDSRIANQWYLSKISMPSAWDITVSNTCVPVAILDSGVDWRHEDLGFGTDSYQNIWLNNGEDTWSDPSNPASGNGVDDDGNGLIDDWKGFNFDLNTNNNIPIFYHGTHVGGIVGAKTNNSTGIAGVAGGNNNEGVRLMCLTVGQSAPNGAVLDDAILYSVNMGARVIQLSLNVGQTSAIDAAIQFAINNGVIVICASGNTSSGASNGSVSYPANNFNVISVGATDQTDHRAPFSNYGNNLTIAAPGVDIESTQISNTYGSDSGTSFAAPQVSAIAALILAINPNLSPIDIRNILTSTADKVGGYTYTNGRCDELGFGRLNAFEALKAALSFAIQGPPQFCTTQNYQIDNLPTGSTVSWSISPTSGVASLSTSGNVATLTKTGNGSVSLSATVNSTCGAISIGPLTIRVGVPDRPKAYDELGNTITSVQTCVDVHKDINLSLPSNDEILEYEWEKVNGTFNLITFGSSATVIGFTPSFGLVSVRARNSCGWSMLTFFSVQVQNCGSFSETPVLNVYPNPSNTYLTIEYLPGADSNQSSKSMAPASKNIELLNGKGEIVKAGKLEKGKSKIILDTSELPDGTYYLHIKDGKETIKKQVIIKH